MAFCSKCGAQTDDNAKFCPSCGAPMGMNGANNNNGGFNNTNNNMNNGGFNNTNNMNNGGNGNNANNNVNNSGFDGVDHTNEFDPQDINVNKAVSAISYLGILFFLPLVCCPNSRFGRFHANQALVMFIASAILGVAYSILSGIFGAIFGTYIGWGWGFDFWNLFDGGFNVIGVIFNIIFWIVCKIPPIAWFLYGLINTLSGKAKELPIIGHFTIIK